MARPRWVRTTDSRHDLPIAPNMLDRNATAEAPSRIWLAGITCVGTDQGWLDLASVLDLYSRKIIGWASPAAAVEIQTADAVRLYRGYAVWKGVAQWLPDSTWQQRTAQV